MRRRSFIARLGGALAIYAATHPNPAHAQSARPAKIGWLKIQDRAETPGWLREFLAGLQGFGHRDGRSYVLEERYADGNSSRLTALAEDLVRSGVAVIVATSQPATEAARKATSSVPIVGRMTDDPIENGMAVSLARPGRNITGIYSLLEEMSPKRLALLQQAVPSLRRVGALLTRDRGATARWLSETETAARQLNLAVELMDVRSAADLDGVFAHAAAQKVGGLLAFRNPTVVTHYRRVVELSDRYRIPGIFDARDFTDAGALMSYGPNLDTIFGRMAFYVDRILSGTPAGELPIEQSARLELVLNLKTAKAMGLTIPTPLLSITDEVIE